MSSVVPPGVFWVYCVHGWFCVDIWIGELVVMYGFWGIGGMLGGVIWSDGNGVCGGVKPNPPKPIWNWAGVLKGDED